MSEFLLPAAVIGGTVLLSYPLGRYMQWAMDTENAASERLRHERLIVRLLGQRAATSQDWKAYCLSMLTFNLLMFVAVYLVVTSQQWLPLNPDGKDALEPSLAFHTAASFTANTNLQHYSGEQTLSYFTQTAAIMWLQFVSAATGIAVLAALARGLSGRTTLGNFYADCWWATGLILLPLSIAWGCCLAATGLPMTYDGAAVATTLEGTAQTISRGPVAAMVAIKQLGTNGGGYFGPNSTHPFENPSFWSNLLEVVAIILVPMACIWMFGAITRRMRHAAVVFGVMTVLYVGFIALAVQFERAQQRHSKAWRLQTRRTLKGRSFDSAALPGRSGPSARRARATAA